MLDAPHVIWFRAPFRCLFQGRGRTPRIRSRRRLRRIRARTRPPLDDSCAPVRHGACARCAEGCMSRMFGRMALMAVAEVCFCWRRWRPPRDCEDAPARFVAAAVNMNRGVAGTGGHRRQSLVEDADQIRLMNLMSGKGPEKLLDAVQGCRAWDISGRRSIGGTFTSRGTCRRRMVASGSCWSPTAAFVPRGGERATDRSITRSR